MAAFASTLILTRKTAAPAEMSALHRRRFVVRERAAIADSAIRIAAVFAPTLTLTMETAAAAVLFALLVIAARAIAGLSSSSEMAVDGLTKNQLCSMWF